MNEKIKELLEAAGFSLWGDEPYKPRGAVVDWNSDYTTELNDFIVDLVTEAANVAAMTTGTFSDEVYYQVIDHFTEPDRIPDRNQPDYEPTEVHEWQDYDPDC